LASTTIDQLKARITSVADRVKRREPDLLLLSGKRLEGIMKNRIFNKGIDSSGSKIGKYKSKKWIKKRSESGRQTDFVDLQFEGNLFRSFKTVRDGEEVVLAIVNNDDALKAFGNEERRNKKIFFPTFEEERQVEEYFEDLLSDEVERAFREL
jgi:hypothetical protein